MGYVKKNEHIFFWFFNSVKRSRDRLELWSKFNDILKNDLIFDK
jgi:hypothetical protein